MKSERLAAGIDTKLLLKFKLKKTSDIIHSLHTPTGNLKLGSY